MQLSTILLPQARLPRALDRACHAMAGFGASLLSTWRRRREDDVRVAATALLLEVALADSRMTDAECRHLHATVQSQFGLNRREAKRLLAKARAARSRDVGLDRMTATIARTYSPAQKARLVEIMKSLAQADGEVSGEEGYRIRTLRLLVRAKRRSIRGGDLVGRGSVTIF